MENVGDKFQQETKYFPEKMVGRQLDWDSKPPTYKEYQNVKTFDLPQNFSMGFKPFSDVIKERKSIRKFSHDSLTPEQLSYLLWASTGVQRKERGHVFRTAPSAGALYPIETYLVVNNVKTLPQGLYHYSIKNHSLELLKEGDFRQEIAFAALEQEMCAEAPVVFVWSAVFERSKWKYSQRAYRYIYLDAGHIAQNLALAATSIELGSCQIAALYDDKANELFGLDGQDESIIYMSTAGGI